jgi:predicted DNA-binding protein (MmcQ/YjbR family)
MPPAPLTRLRRLCLALPEAEEIETWDTPTFRIRGKIFALVSTHRDAPAVWVKAPPGVQQMLVEAAPERFFRPPYMGRAGWIGVTLGGRVDWGEVGALVRRSFGLVAPKRIARTLPEG